MFEHVVRFAMVSAVTLLLSALPAASGQTWHLQHGQDWRPVQPQGQDKFLLAVAQIKKLVNTGQTEAVRLAVVQLKKDFPEIAGPDFDAFIEAELLFCKGKFVKAARGYGKFLTEYPESELYEAALDRQFAIATVFLAGQKKTVLGVFRIRGYAEGANIMERVSDRAGDAPIAISAAVAVAESLQRRGKFNEAYHKWSEIQSRWPMGQCARDALLGKARCKHAAYKGPEYDASNLVSARSYYEDFRLQYHKDAEKIGVDEILKQINEQLAYKQFSIGRYYQKTGNRQSANLYYQMVMDNWPESPTAEMASKQLKSEKCLK